MTVRVRDDAPSNVEVDGWDEVVETSVEAIVGELIVTSGFVNLEQEFPVLTPHGPGYYRVRVHARGRDIAVDDTVTEPVEDFLIEVWPAPHTPETIYKATDNYGVTIRQAATEQIERPPASQSVLENPPTRYEPAAPYTEVRTFSEEASTGPVPSGMASGRADFKENPEKTIRVDLDSTEFDSTEAVRGLQRHQIRKRRPDRSDTE